MWVGEKKQQLENLLQAQKQQIKVLKSWFGYDGVRWRAPKTGRDIQALLSLISVIEISGEQALETLLEGCHHDKEIEGRPESMPSQE